MTFATVGPPPDTLSQYRTHPANLPQLGENTMLEKFKALPKGVQIVIGIVVVGLILGALSA